MKNYSAFLSFSGGLDSTMLLMYLLSQQKYKSIYCISFKYGQKHSIELEKAQNIINFLKTNYPEYGNIIQHQIVDVRSIFEGNSNSSLLNDGLQIPLSGYTEDSMKSTVVPIRNIIFSSILYSKASSSILSDNQRVDIALGVHSQDNSNYPDCRPASVEGAQKLYKLSDYNGDLINYLSPFINLTKGELLEIGLDSMRFLKLTPSSIQYILENTHSCYNPSIDSEGNVYSCGKCGTCSDRLEAFKTIKRTDPILYAN